MLRTRNVCGIVALISVSLFLVCCSPARQAKKADETAYKTIKGGRKVVLGEQKPFEVLYKPFGETKNTPGVIKIRGKAIPLGSAGPVALSLAECLEIAFRNSRDFQDRKEELFSAALNLANERRAWNWTLFGGELAGGASHDKVNRGAEDNLGTADALANLTKRLVNGGVLTLAMSLNLATDFLGAGGTTVGSLLEANFTQPLLRGAWRGFAYEEQYRLERDFVIAVFDYERFKQTFAADIATRFYSVLQQRDRLNNEAANIERLKKTVRTTKVLVEGPGRVSKVQLYQSRQNLLRAEVRYQQNVENYRNALDEFKILIGLPVVADVELDTGALEELQRIGPKAIPFENENEAIKVALSVRPDLLTERARVRDARRDVEIAADAFLPQLDLELDVDASGTEPRKFQRVRFHRYRRFAGLTFNYDLDQTDNRDAYRNAVIAFEKSKRDYEEFLDDVRLEVRRSYRLLEQSYRSYMLQLENVKIGRTRQKLAAEQFRKGMLSARDKLEADEALLNAEDGLTSALVSYTTTRLQFLATLGMLWVDEKGMFHERAEPQTFERISKRYAEKHEDRE